MIDITVENRNIVVEYNRGTLENFIISKLINTDSIENIASTISG